MEDKLPFKPGDVVFLKSGGPAMTVEVYDPEHRTCVLQWFMADLNVLRRQFNSDMIRKDESAQTKDPDKPQPKAPAKAK